jgi:hypothetical protein
LEFVFRIIRTSAAVAAGCLTLSLSAGCGGDAIVQIDGATHASIGERELDQRMQSMVDADFRKAIGTQGPHGFVSEPADYPRCINAARLVAPRSFFNQLRANRAQLNQACHALYRSVKAQALSFLIAAKWTGSEAARRGVKIADADVKRANTHCVARDVVPGCSAYHGPASISPSPQEILTHLVKPTQEHQTLSLGPSAPAGINGPTAPR